MSEILMSPGRSLLTKAQNKKQKTQSIQFVIHFYTSLSKAFPETHQQLQLLVYSGLNVHQYLPSSTESIHGPLSEMFRVAETSGLVTPGAVITGGDP